MSAPATTEAPGSTTTETLAPTTEPTMTSAEPDGPTGEGCDPLVDGLTDGRWYGYVPSADDAGIEFDVACWYTGRAAEHAAAEDGEESPPPNDYYIRNDDETIVLVPVPLTTKVRWLPDIGDPSGEQVVTFAEWIDLRATRYLQLGVWLKVSDGEVVEITEQYVP